MKIELPNGDLIERGSISGVQLFSNTKDPSLPWVVRVFGTDFSTQMRFGSESEAVEARADVKSKIRSAMHDEFRDEVARLAHDAASRAVNNILRSRRHEIFPEAADSVQ